MYSFPFLDNQDLKLPESHQTVPFSSIPEEYLYLYKYKQNTPQARELNRSSNIDLMSTW